MIFQIIENNLNRALFFEEAGIERIFIDLEKNGKQERQHFINSVKSNHDIKDISKIKKNLSFSKVLVRINPIHEKTKMEIDKVIDNGADIIMLPMFKTVKEVEKFFSIINNRIKTILLFETAQAYTRLDQILKIDEINEAYIGLNDLHLSLGLNFLFEPLSCGLVDSMIKKFKQKNIICGFGGIARKDDGLIPGWRIMEEHARLKTNTLILSRAFSKVEYNSVYELKEEITSLKKVYNKHLSKSKEYKESRKIETWRLINEYVKNKLI